MKMFKVNLVAMLICLAAATPAFASPKYKDGDWQLWNDETLKAKINDQFGVYVEQEFRWGNNISQYYYEHTHLQLDWKPLSWLTIAPAFREIYELNSKEIWYAEHEPQLNISGNWKIFENWTFDARARIEYRIFNDPTKSDIWRNRDKFTLKSPWKLTPLNLNPYIADEIFIQENQDGLSENRLWIGLGMQFFKNLKGDISYIWREVHQSDNSWLESNVIQAQLKFEF